MKIRNLFIAATTVAVIAIVAAPVSAQRGTLPNNLFSQYYTQGAASTAHAAMYPAPHPVPRNVGHTYYTYQPLMPHEMMYTHTRNYYNYYAGPEAFYSNMCRGGDYPGGHGLNKTTVRWQNGCSHMAPLPSSMVPFQKWYYQLNSRRYCHPRGVFGLGVGSLFDGLGVRRGCSDGSCGSYGYDDGYGYEGLSYGGCSDCVARAEADWARRAYEATAKLQNGRVQR